MKATSLTTVSGLRDDGRRPGEARTPGLSIRVLSHFLRPVAVTYTLGNTVVEVTLVGPYDPDDNVLKSYGIPVPTATARSGELSFCVYQNPAAPGGGMKSEKTRELEEALGRLFPIDVTANVFVYILQDDGGVLPACVAAVSCALTSGGVPVPFVLGGCEMGDVGGEILVDVTAEERRRARAQGSCSVCIVLRWKCAVENDSEPTVCGVWMDGKMADMSLLTKFRDAVEAPAASLVKMANEQQKRYLEGQA